MSERLRLLILALLICYCTGCEVNPITGQDEFMLVSEEEDIAIGRKYAPEVEKQLGGRIADDCLQYYLDSVGQKIARISHKPHWEYHFTAVEDKSTNAFALPGGHIFITKGMLEKLQTEAQLAALLSHEIVHVVARHSAAAQSRQGGLLLLVVGLGAAGAFPKDMPEGSAKMAQLALQLISLTYSREQEREADLGGVDYAVVAGYDPNGAVELQKMLQEQNDIRPIEFISTHPSPGNRIISLQGRIQARYQNLADLRIGREDYRTNILERLND